MSIYYGDHLFEFGGWVMGRRQGWCTRCAVYVVEEDAAGRSMKEPIASRRFVLPSRRGGGYADGVPECRGMRKRMIVKIELRGSHVHIHTENKDEFSITAKPSQPMLSRMRGRAVAYFEATAAFGGGTGKDGRFYENPTEIIEIGDEVSGQSW